MTDQHGYTTKNQRSSLLDISSITFEVYKCNLTDRAQIL